jgi:glycosyltransferase involved in cell wall biosynthesis
MKIAIVSFYCLESTIPLAKHLSIAGAKVDLYCLMSDGDQNGFVVNFSTNKQPNGFVDSKIAKNAMNEKLYNYLSTINVNFFIFPIKWFRRIFLQDIYYSYLLAKHVQKRKYDIIHIIHTSKRFWIFFYLFANKKKIVQTLHEVTAHESKTSLFNRLILYFLIKYSTPIIFHSNISKKRFIEFRKIVKSKVSNEDNLTIIRFGVFITYKFFASQSVRIISNDKINILNFGRIVPYKSINILVDAIKLLQDKYPVHLVIAGEGKPYFNFNDILSYEFINRALSNEEIVKLIEECDMVVLPYSSVSQSGVPMTVFPFGKPIIANNIAGFKEVIDHQKTGLLVDNLNAQSLASSIEILITDQDLKMNISKNIEKKYNEGEYSWTYIAEATLSFYKRHLKE